MEIVYLAIAIGGVAIIAEKSGRLGAMFLLIIVLSMLFVAQQKGKI